MSRFCRDAKGPHRFAARLIGGMVLWAAVAPGRCPPLPAAEDELAATRTKLREDFARRLEALAAKCDQLGLADAARATRAWIIRHDPGRLYLFVPPEVERLPQPAPDAPKLVRQWHERLMKDRAARAEQLFKLYAEALRARRPALAYRLLHETLHENPCHEPARKILGYEKVGDAWCTPFAARRLRAGQVPHPKFGWLPAADVKRYEAGLRPLGGRWVSPAEEERYRGASIDHGWPVETEHFLITTDHSLEAGVELGRHLEDVYSVWRQLMVGYWAEGVPTSRRFRGTLVRSADKHKVVLFRNRDEYVAHLRKEEPQVGITLGMYLDRRRTSFFYPGDRQAVATWSHEATHQLFRESRGATGATDAAANFWVTEAFPLYMESLRRHRGYCTTGGIAADRLQFARYRVLSEGFYVPLAELTTFSREQMQHDERIGHLYSQSAGLGHFLMHYDGGRYQAALVAYLRVVYRGRHDAHALARLTGATYQNLDAEYRRFLNVTDDDLAGLQPSDDVRRLALGHTDVTDQGVNSLGDPSELVWLDLSFTKVTDAAVAHVAGASKMKQLSLEQTAVTDAALETIRQFKELEELDLSGTSVTDAGLANLAGLKSLRVLWLTGTRVSDAGLAHLKGLARLEQLDVTGTRVTPGGLAALKRLLPALKD